MSARNWTEDATHENGNYDCRCSTCGESFIGHKRRVTCKLCASVSAKPTEADDLRVEHLASYDVRYAASEAAYRTAIRSALAAAREEARGPRYPDYCYSCERPCKYAGLDPENGAARCRECRELATLRAQVRKLEERWERLDGLARTNCDAQLIFDMQSIEDQVHIPTKVERVS